MITFVLIAALVGLAAWAVTTYVPMPAPIKTVIVVGAVLLLVLYLVRLLGLERLP